MVSLDKALYPSHCLELSGLGDAATEILKSQNLKNEENWLELINLYEGHPRYLQDIGLLIKEIFNCEVSEFLKENAVIISEDLKSLLNSILTRLYDVEKTILFKMAAQEQAMSRDDIKQSLSLSSMDIINGLQSLNRRFLLNKLTNDEKLFYLSAVFREYLKTYHLHV